ncbi:MAG: site-specific DNA-methyltransferase [Chloroflexota bacterium]
MVVSGCYKEHFLEYKKTQTTAPIFFHGDALHVLKELPDSSVDMAMTSPPYWSQREYENGGIGLERNYHEYIERLLVIFQELWRVLKPSGSFWLNVGDAYSQKRLLAIPWRIAIAMIDQQGWILRNHVVWHKVKGGPDNAKDKLRNVWEPLFHFVKQPKGYYYNIDAVRLNPRKASIKDDGTVISATGVRGVRYRRQIELSTTLTEKEKQEALQALDKMLEAVAEGKIADFRMIIRGQQRVTHSDSESVSGRAKELNKKGFYFLKYHPRGAKPSDVWDIIPEDTQKRTLHFAPYPEELCRIPILVSCPSGGIVLDPFCGTGTTNLVASKLGRKSVGIDISQKYLIIAQERCATML